MTSASSPQNRRQVVLRPTFRRAVLAGLLSLFLLPKVWATPLPQARNALQIYFIDVEGGQATLFVTPGGQSLLIDTGWPGNDGRDADRIVAAAREAAINKIDFVLVTHFHQDHAGGLTQLAARIPIGRLIDHGDNREHTDPPTEQAWQDYQRLLAKKNLKRMIGKPGDVLPIPDIEAKVISSDGALIELPLPGAGGVNPSCTTSEQRATDQTENPRSLGTIIKFGKLRILDLGDLTWDKEMELVCPVNKLGPVDIYIVSHHGSSQSNSPALLNGITPRVAIMDNGATKGGSRSSWNIIEKSPRLEDLWQLHFSSKGGTAHNVAERFIANLPGPDAGNYLRLSAWPDGSFDVFNSRTKITKHYAAAH
ncbi:MAG: MBL fold metallo-hydrolase [Acidobacteria bacterium]|nr:MAG: MBL fold metallo-hydrolase [Acidobacteriota bacterium]